MHQYLCRILIILQKILIMKTTFLLGLITLLLQIPLFSQTNLGHIITSEGETIEIFKRNDKKTKLTKMTNDCDCERKAGVSFLFINSEGKVKSLKQSKIDKVLIKKGARYCEEFSTGGVGTTSFNRSLGAKLEKDFEMLSLPLKKGGGARVLQYIWISNDKYMLTMYQTQSMDQKMSIYDKSKNQLIEGGYSYGQIGYSKAGKKALSSIKRYFKDCSNIIEEIDDTLAHNKTVKRLKMIPVLHNVSGMECGE